MWTATATRKPMDTHDLPDEHTMGEILADPVYGDIMEQVCSFKNFDCPHLAQEVYRAVALVLMRTSKRFPTLAPENRPEAEEAVVEMMARQIRRLRRTEEEPVPPQPAPRRITR